MQDSPASQAYKFLLPLTIRILSANCKAISQQLQTSKGMDDCNPVTSVRINSTNKRRFSDDQLKSLESMFSSESRPGSKTKQHIADQLGLHPRQVAIWFQNRRARTKSKQTERDYSILKSRYDNLSSQLEVLKNENQSLTIEVQRLRRMQETLKDSISDSAPATGSSNEESTFLNALKKHVAQPEDYTQDTMLCDTTSDGCKNLEQETDPQENFDMVDSVDCSLASSRNHSSLEATYLFEPNCVPEWWEFWT